MSTSRALRRNGRDTRGGEAPVVVGGQRDRAIQAGGVEVQLRRVEQRRVGDDLEPRAVAEREDGAGLAAGEFLGLFLRGEGDVEPAEQGLDRLEEQLHRLHLR
ncbi:MAG TPA: hypothetical protein VF070_27830 [Streptosporangiaceae bacterium]